MQRRIITIEEPVEYRLPGVSQIDVKPEISLTFAQRAAAHSAAGPERHHGRGNSRFRDGGDRHPRGDDGPPCVLARCTRMTPSAASRGCWTWASSRSCSRAWCGRSSRSGWCGPSARIASDAGELSRRISEGDRRSPIEPGHPHYSAGAGCDHCRQTGYRGRAAIYEICVITEGLRKLIVRKTPGNELKQRATLDGMETLRQDGWRRVLRGRPRSRKSCA